MSVERPGKGLMGWLGRQVGHVRAAVRHDPAVVAKRERVEEKADPAHPGLTFRRTVVDEVRRQNQNDRPDAPAGERPGVG